MIKLGACSGDCGKDSVPIVNRKRMLCNDCNKSRLSVFNPESKGEAVKHLVVKASSIKSSGINKGLTPKAINSIKEDELFYEKVWNLKPHECEECGQHLGDELRDESGKMFNKWRFSHILPKGGMYAMFRRDVRNINLLCLEHHNEWEHGWQPNMNIWVSNSVVIQEMRNEIKKLNGRS